MKEILKFSINNKQYTIYDINTIEGKPSYVGESQYDEGIILIEEGTKEQMLTTLKHELAHVWLYENGHPYQAGGCFTYEDMCEYIAFSNNFVYEISQRYLDAKSR